MRVTVVIAIVSLAVANPAAAQFNAYYEGSHLVGGKQVPLATQFSADKDHAVAIMKAEQSYRMVYTVKDNTLRVFDDGHKTYVDFDRASLEQVTGGAMAQMQAQMAKVPPEQQAMMEKMLAGAMGTAKQEPLTYVTRDEHTQVLGYDCTRVDAMRGERKVAEYWGSTSPDFKIGDAERKAIIGMNGCLNGLNALETRGGPQAETRPFEFDTEANGYPLISRCVEDTVRTLDVQLVRYDRKPLAGELWAVPGGYTKQDMGGMTGGSKGQKHHGH